MQVEFNNEYEILHTKKKRKEKQQKTQVTSCNYLHIMLHKGF